MIKWEQMVFLGNPEFGCDLQPIAFVAFTKAYGATGMAIEDPVDCGQILDRALATPTPVIVEAIVDPFTPPMPGKITDQARKFAESLARGEPNRSKMPGPCFQTKCGSLYRGGEMPHTMVPENSISSGNHSLVSSRILAHRWAFVLGFLHCLNAPSN